MGDLSRIDKQKRHLDAREGQDAPLRGIQCKGIVEKVTLRCCTNKMLELRQICNEILDKTYKI